MEMIQKYLPDSSENREFVRSIRENLLEFGKNFPSPEGSSYYLGDDGTPWTDRPRETWITSRMVHVYSIGAILGYNGCRELAAEGLRGLCTELRDHKNGGWFAGIRADGKPLENKQCYAHAFVILAACSALLAGIEGARDILRDALDVYDRYFWDEKAGLAADTWDTDFKVPDDYRGLNANMHSVEAFLAVYDTLGSEEYLNRAGRIIDHVLDWASDNNWRIPEHFTRDWQPDLECNKDRPDDPFKPYGATPGHGIEWARLIIQWASAAEKYLTAAGKYTEAAKKLYDRAVTDAWACDGAPGIVYTTDWEGNPVVHDRMHWTLAEAINTSAVLYRVSGDERYKQDYSAYMEYLDKYVLDHVHGSWLHQLHRDNTLKGTVWPGKSDLYHAFQATLIPYNPRIGVSIAAAETAETGDGSLSPVKLEETENRPLSPAGKENLKI